MIVRGSEPWREFESGVVKSRARSQKISDLIHQQILTVDMEKKETYQQWRLSP